MRKKQIHKLLNLAQNMIDKEKSSEALEVLNSLEPVDNYTEYQKARFYTLKSIIHRILGDFPKAYETGEKSVLFARKIELGVEIVDAFLNMARILHFMGKNQECSKLLEESFEILTNLPQISEKDRNWRMGLLYFYKANNFFKLGDDISAMESEKKSIDLLEKWGPQVHLARAYASYGCKLVYTGEFDKSLYYSAQSQKICEHKESPTYRMSKMLNLFATGAVYWNKNELQLALESIKKGAALARKYDNTMFLHMGLNAVGSLYYELGEWDHTIKYYKEAIQIAENFGSNEAFLLSNIHELFINQGDKSSAPQIFQKIEQYRDKEKDNKWFNLFYRMKKALVLKKSKRTRDLGAAQEIFKTIAHEEIISLEMTQKALLNLCEMLLAEFKDTKNVDVLDEFSPLLVRLREVAKKRHSYKILAESYVLDAKLSMIHFDYIAARHSLTQAQEIAEKYRLKRLAIKISNEHDKLLQNSELWKQMEKDNIPISERFEKIDLNYQSLMLSKQKPTEIPETTPESPIFLLIMANSGIPLYTKIFSKELEITEELFSGFLSAFNSFSDEIFSEGLDRAHFGKFTILMRNIPPFMSCYVFEGQTFLAQQKFSQFNETLHNSKPMWQKLTSAKQTGQVIKDDTGEGLGQLVKSIF